MRKIFIDVGGYAGESIRAALDPIFAFDLVYCFEPVKSCFDSITKHIYDSRLRLINAGLFDKTCDLPVHFAGSVGGSIYSDAPRLGPNEPENCHFIAASEFFAAEIHSDDLVWMKLNCEGAECAIVSDLFSAEQHKKITELLIDFDAQKIPSVESRVNETKALLSTGRLSYHFPEEVQYGMVTNYGGIRNWLTMSGANDRNFKRTCGSLVYQIKYICDSHYNGYYKVRMLRFLGLRSPPSLQPIPATRVFSRVLSSKPKRNRRKDIS